MSAWLLIVIAVLHGSAAIAQIIKGDEPMAWMLLGFTIADLALAKMAYNG